MVSSSIPAASFAAAQYLRVTMAMSAILAHDGPGPALAPGITGASAASLSTSLGGRPPSPPGLPSDGSAGWRCGRLSMVLLLTDAPEPAAEILPSLSLLAHVIRTAPASATAANGGSGTHAILVDARRDL